MSKRGTGAVRILSTFLPGWFFLLLFLLPEQSLAQNLLNNPESVVYDSLRHRYIVSNWGDGAIVQIDTLGQQSYYTTLLQQRQYHVAGLYIHGDTLLAAAGDAPNPGIAAFDLESAELLFTVIIPDIGLPNDITTDSDGTIYVTDYWDNKLYSIEGRTPSVFWDHGLGYPNGMMYDAPNDRLLLLSVMGPGSPVLAVSLADSLLSTVVTTGLSGTDGITMDSEGRYYISEWTGDTIRRYENDFSGAPEVFSSGHNDPADIYYDRVNDSVIVPNFSSHSLDSVPINPLLVEAGTTPLPKTFGLRQNYPNPFNPSTAIAYSLSGTSEVRISIYNMKGKLVRRFDIGERSEGTHTVIWDGRDSAGGQVGSGIYFCRFEAGERVDTRKMVLLK